MPFKLLYDFGNGIRCGWREGFSSVLSKAWRLFLTGSSAEQNQNLGEELRNPRVQPQARNPWAFLLPAPIANPLANLMNRAMTSAEFEELSSRVPQADNYCESLTQEEKEQLVSNPHQDWESYKNLDRLDSDECAIARGRPIPKETILLFKQYQDADGTWKSVPNAAHIFDKVSLKSALVDHTSKHPLTREWVLAPEAYNGHQTRYAIHPYYTAEGKTISLERHVLTLSLREHLVTSMLRQHAQKIESSPRSEVQHHPSPLVSVNLAVQNDDADLKVKLSFSFN